MKHLIRTISVFTALLFAFSTFMAAFAEEPQAVAIDKEAFDALIASGPVAGDDVIAASAWAAKVKEAGVLRVGGTRTSFLFSQLTRRITAFVALTPDCISFWQSTSWATRANSN